MMDYILRRLPNGQILVRNIKTGEKLTLKLKDLGDFFLQEYDETPESAREEQDRIEKIQNELAKRGI